LFLFCPPSGLGDREGEGGRTGDQLTGTSYLLKAAGSHKSQNRVPGRDVDSETQRQLRRKSGREWVGGPAASAWSFRGISGACGHGGEFSILLSPCFHQHPDLTSSDNVLECSTERLGVSSHSPEVLLGVQLKVYMMKKKKKKVYMRQRFPSKVTQSLDRLGHKFTLVFNLSRSTTFLTYDFYLASLV
jgi:hypothetical protein